VKERVYLVLTKQGVDRMVKREPSPARNEYIVAVLVTVPDTVFDKAPIPVVELTLAGTHLGVADIVIDGEKARVPLDEAARKQQIVQTQLAALFTAARNSTDANMQSEAKMTLQVLLDSGVDVRIVHDDEPSED
jgi:hypothetical protein